jgi:signal transduction histidine kinase/HAMP domain-containing protein
MKLPGLTTIKRKQTFVIMLTSCAALLLASTGFVAYEVVTFRRTLTRHLETLAQVLGNNCTGALDFNDRQVAEEVLSALRVEPDIVAACIYSKDGRIFATYSAAGEGRQVSPPLLQANGARFEGDRLVLFQRIMHHREVVGTIYLESTLVALSERLWQYANIAACVLLASILVAFLLSARLQRVVSGPILQLVRATRVVARQQNYAVRVPKESEDEIGLLIDNFNEMVAEIETRDHALARARAELEQRVIERTRELQMEVAERRQAEEELSAIYEHAPIMMFLLDGEGRVHRLNRTALEASGCQLERALHAGLGQVLNCLHASEAGCGGGTKGGCAPCRMHALLQSTLQSGASCRRTEVRLRVVRDQQPRDIVLLASSARVEVSHQPMVLVCLEDISDRKQLEDQFRQAQKMEAIGQLAGGVAHDFNNILAATLLQLNLLQEHPRLTPELRAGLRELEKGTNRAAVLTRQLLTFGRRQLMQVSPLELNELLANLLKMLRRLLGEQIDLTFQGNAGPLWTKADAGMMEQVVMNLCVNARDAMPHGGRLTIGLNHVEIDATAAKANTEARPGPFVCLSVDDTGCGMDKAILKRIFEPFYTTKEVGRGTGLGLATVYGIVKQHQGWIEVESEVDHGSRFRVFLPAHQGEQTVQPAVPVPPRLPRGRETILVVEDDESVRTIAVLSLQHLGYQVLEAATGVKAMELWNQHRDQIRLLLTDMVMPEGMSGLELVEQLQQINSALKAIISSGYSVEMTRLGNLAERGIAYLAKPYEVKTLATVVRRCLDQN